MKKLIIIALIVLFTSTGFAMGRRPDKKNLDVWGSNDNQKRGTVPIEQPEPNPPVAVPEPGSLVLLAYGVALVLVARKVVE